MKKWNLTCLLFILLINHVFPQDSVSNRKNAEILFEISKDDFINKIKSIWKTDGVILESKVLNFNGFIKDYLVYQINLNQQLSEDELDERAIETRGITWTEITNISVFRGGKINYRMKSESKTKEGEIPLYEFLDKSPVAKGCNKNLKVEDQKSVL